MTESIVLTVCAKYRVKPAEFFSPQRGGVVTRCRRAAIKAFIEAGFTKLSISRLTRLDYSTVRYWASKERREKKRAAMRAYRRGH